MSSFANTAGGIILLGLDEENDFKPVECFAIDKVLDQFITGMGDGNPQGARIVQPPGYHPHRFTFEGSPVLTIEIEELEADKKPCYVAGRGIVGGSYKRIDDQDIRLSPTEIYSFANYLKPSYADRQPVKAATVEDFIDCGWAAWSSVQISNDIEHLIEEYGDRIGFVGGFDSNGPVAREDADPEAVQAEVRRCLDTYGKYHKGYCFFGFRYANSLDPEVIASVMAPIAQGATEYAFELLAAGK